MGKIKNFIEKLAKANEKNIGNKRLDCCTINQNTNKNLNNKKVNINK